MMHKRSSLQEMIVVRGEESDKDILDLKSRMVE